MMIFILHQGGQILRNAVAVSCLLTRPIHITRIRAGRSKPGLAAQHLTGIQVGLGGLVPAGWSSLIPVVLVVHVGGRGSSPSVPPISNCISCCLSPADL